MAIKVIGQYRPRRLHTKNCRHAEACFKVRYLVAITRHHLHHQTHCLASKA